VQGIVQLNTTYTNPVRTVKGHELQERLQEPVYEPLLHVITAVSPVVRGLNWLGYQSGLIHLQTASSSFAGTETREQLDFASRYYYRSSRAVVARGTLGMLHWDASDVLDRIPVPVLIVSGDQDTTSCRLRATT
jgi:pimeloyl-ACP methyl ester carboxylesterase